ncbi:MAG TPA: hypothetical protein VMW38_11160 [Terriglobia bacterium]|nr:hypothetical protein [Terriglobia bacterium]
MKRISSRRKFLTATGAGALGTVLAHPSRSIGSSQTQESPQANPPILAELPTVQLGKHKISRLIIGGNPFSFIPHAEPLLYSSRLFRQYFTHEKVVEILSLGVHHGINTFLGRIDENVLGFLKLYEKTNGSRMPWIAQTSAKPQQGATKKDIEKNIGVAADNGAIGCYIQGESADYFVAQKNLRDLADHVSLIRRLGMLVGIGAHQNETIEQVQKEGILPDFYMKTLNRAGYYAANPDRTPEIMARAKIPWIAFKTLAAGRIEPEEGFRYALKAGAYCLCVGMFDFQVEDNARLARRLMSKWAV